MSLLSFLTKTKILENEPDEYRRIFSIFILSMKEVLFNHLKFNRIFTETYSLRQNHIDILEENGFLLEGTQREKIFINGIFFNSLIHSIIKSDER